MPLLCLLPLVIIAVLAFLTRADPPIQPAPAAQASPAALAPKTRLVVVVVDSLRPESMDQWMPNVRALAERPGAARIDVTTGSANFTLPCLQTLLEGRESPFVATVHNFTGRKGSDNSLPSAAQRSGLGVALISNFILDSLYRQHALYSTDVTRWGRTYLYRDLRGIDKAIAHLQDPRVDVLILHIPGTDKVAHQWHPGHPKYEEHLRAVDARLARLFAGLDLQHDHLLVTGDHGHDLGGTHERRSVAFLLGGEYSGLLETLGRPSHLNQTDLLFFMSFPLRLPLPVDYEGDYFNLASALTGAGDGDGAALEARRTPFTEFAAVQKDFLVRAGSDPALLAQSVEVRQRQVAAAHLRDLLTYAPILIWYLIWIVMGFRTNETRSGMITLWGAALAAPLLWLLSTPRSAGPLAAGLALFAFFYARRHGETSRLLTLALLAVAAAFISSVAQGWDQFFGSVAGLNGWLMPALLALVGGGVAWMRYGTLRALPEGVGAVCLFCLPSGVYDHQFGGNIVRGLFIGGGLTIFWLWVARLRSSNRPPPLDLRHRYLLATAVLGVSVVLLLCTEGSGWMWRFMFRDWLKGHGWWLAAILYALAGVYLIFAAQSRAARGAVILGLLVMPVYSTWIGQLRFYTLATTLIPLLLFASWLVMAEARWSLRHLVQGTSERTGLVLLACLFMTFWIALSGFFLNQADFTFGFKYFGTLQRESLTFLLIYLATLLKYGLPVAFLVLVYFPLSEPEQRRQTIVAALLFCHFKVLTLFLQILAGRIQAEQKRFELALSDLLFVVCVPLIVVTTSYALTGIRAICDRCFSAPKVPLAHPQEV